MTRETRAGADSDLELQNILRLRPCKDRDLAYGRLRDSESARRYYQVTTDALTDEKSSGNKT